MKRILTAVQNACPDNFAVVQNHYEWHLLLDQKEAA